nr:MAG TPA: hypothetical protein [Caudoviricetes sp.]
MFYHYSTIMGKRVNNLWKFHVVYLFFDFVVFCYFRFLFHCLAFILFHIILYLTCLNSINMFF